MALKTDRHEVITDISFFMNETAERGGVAVLSTVGSGGAMDQSQALVTYAATPAGRQPVGILLNDMVNIDQTRQHINQHKNEVQQGGKVTILRAGHVVTNRIAGGTVVYAGAKAYLGPSGFLQITQGTASGLPYEPSNPTVGYFMSSRDEDGYAKVAIQLS
jgi:hypothetical protein